jgi:hypothetical protein
MKLSRKTHGLILGVAAFASAMLVTDTIRGQNVYSSNVGSFLNVVPYSGTNYAASGQWGVSTSNNFYGVDQGYEVVWYQGFRGEQTPYTRILLGTHTFPVRTPEYFLANRRRLITAAAGLSFLTALAAVRYFSRPTSCRSPL